MSFRFACYFPAEEPLFFTASVDRDGYIADLREVIHQKLKDLGQDVPLKELTLYKTDIPLQPSVDRAHRARQFLHEHPEALDAAETVEKVFPSGPHRNERLDILVAIPEKSSTSQTFTDRAALLHKEVYGKAWGHPWPHRREVITNEDCGLDGDTQMQVDDEPIRNEAPKCWWYTCLDDIFALGVTNLLMTVGVPFSLVIRDEYEWVREHLERVVLRGANKAGDHGGSSRSAFVLTGQPGIGKSMFLLYILLYRLERRLPTAIQVRSTEYIVFDSEGVAVFPMAATSTRLSDCWALCDSNSAVSAPCEAFLSLARVIIQATSARKERWKEWSKQKAAKVIVMDLPHPLEIAAIAQQAKLNPTDAIAVMKKWGPATRTVLGLLDIDSDASHRSMVISAAQATARSIEISSPDRDQLHSHASALLFLLPVRVPIVRDGDRLDLSSHVLEIPTPTLAAIFEDERAKFSTDQALKLFATLSSHSLTRTAAGWAHEKIMHVCMSRGGEPMDLIPQGKIQPATKLLSGAVSALGLVGETDTFYWLPSAANFEGVDGVLGNQHGIFALQATIASNHTSPVDGLVKVWKAMRPASRRKRWHFVFFTDGASLAQRYLDEIAAMGGLSIGRTGVQVWGCVAPKQL